MKVRYGDLAKADLENIFLYTVEHWGWRQADAYVDELDRILNEVQAGNTSIRAIPERPGLFRVRAGSHFAIFTQSSDLIEVRRILHVSMDTLQHI